ncbi:MAG TPA: hypothetical protein PKM73_14985 [Verrucomicrobiota bacterium]|nr:hypothetical protein [Verrucomicrobiota bacterium]HNU52643.1 hypothetical protein [Verrucomicrobiota bacterium]
MIAEVLASGPVALPPKPEVVFAQTLRTSAPTTVKISLRGDGIAPIVVTAPAPALEPCAATEVSLGIDPKRVAGEHLQAETTVGHPDAASSITTDLRF